jgi:hypothetical protein
LGLRRAGIFGATRQGQQAGIVSGKAGHRRGIYLYLLFSPAWLAFAIRLGSAKLPDFACTRIAEIARRQMSHPVLSDLYYTMNPSHDFYHLELAVFPASLSERTTEAVRCFVFLSTLRLLLRVYHAARRLDVAM